MPPLRRPAAARPQAARATPAKPAAPAGDLAARFGTAESGQQLLDRVLPLSLAALPVSKPSDPAEREADRIAADSARGSRTAPTLRGLAERGRTAGLPRGVAALSSGGSPLPAVARAHYEPRFGQSLADVRVHTGPAAEQVTGAFRARALSYGDHIFMGPGQRVQPSPLLAHELAHVAQQRATGRLLVARQAAPEDDPDRNVSLPLLDSGIIADVAPHVLGDAQFALMRELLRGIVGGAQSAPPAQKAHIRTKFSSIGVSDTLHFAEGYTIGVGEGIWSSIKGLFEGIFHLIKLPYDIEQFITVKLPDLVVKYAPQLQRLAREGEEIAAIGRQMLHDFLANPAAGAQQVAKLLEGLRDVALGKVRALGHDAVQKFLSFLDEPWQQFGEDIGKIAGMILFEVLLAVGTDAIGSLVRGAGEIAGRLAARVAASTVELFAAARRLFGTALEAAERLAGRVAGKLGELLERLKGILRRLVEIIEEMMGERAVTDTGVHVPVPKEPQPNIFEARAHKPPVRTSPARVEDLKPPKIHPSRVETPPRPAKPPGRSSPLRGVDAVPSVREGAFSKWFNGLSPDEFDKLWANPELRATIEDRLRSPGGMHEWHLVSRANVFKRWGVTAEQIAELRTATGKVRFVNPIGRHGGRGSALAHNELLDLIDESSSYREFRKRLRRWASRRLRGGVAALPPGLQSD